MKKIKVILILSLIAILAGGIMIGCSSKYTVDRAANYRIVYCGNGGTIGESNSEKIFYVSKNSASLAPEPGKTTTMLSQEIVKAPTPNEGLAFVGWAKGKTDENGDPVYREQPIRPDLDGGSWLNRDGLAITDAAKAEEDRKQKPTTHIYYDYEVDAQGNPVYWDFNQDRVGEDIALVAIWKERSYFLLAEKDDSGAWLDYSFVNSADFNRHSPKFEELQKENKIRQVADINNELQDYEVEEQYNALYNSEVDEEGNPIITRTSIDFYSDPNLSEDSLIDFGSFRVTHYMEVIYYDDIEGDYDIVKNYSDFGKAINENRNVYLLNDIDAAEMASTFNSAEYTGIIKGNSHTLKGLKASLAQKQRARGEENTYSAIFGKLKGAEISDLDIEVSMQFTIGVDPVAAATQMGSSEPNPDLLSLNSTCDVAVFALSMEDCKIEKVNVTVTLLPGNDEKLGINRTEVSGMPYWGDDGQLHTPVGKNEYAVTVNFFGWTPSEDTPEGITDSSVTGLETSDDEPVED